MSQALVRTLVHIQAHLDEDLSLHRLSERAGLSASKFHRAFRAWTGGFGGLPTLEIYHETVINVDSTLNHTDVYVPVAAVTDRAGFDLGR